MRVPRTIMWLGSVAAPALLAACGGAEQNGDAATTSTAASAPAPPPPNPLMNPTSQEMKETAPPVFRVQFATSAGDFVVEVTRAWAPNGADRFYNLVKHGFYDEARFFRVMPNFVVQFGINADPQVSARWQGASIQDDPVKQGNKRGTLTFAKSSAPNSRTTQVFINYADNTQLDSQGFAAFGRVVSGMPVTERINASYGQTPNQGLIQTQGNAYLQANFPNLDYIKTATVVQQ